MRRRTEVGHYPGFGLILVGFFVYLYAPTAVVIFFSFNASKLSAIWGGFSLRWYASALQNRALLDAVLTSLKVGATPFAFLPIRARLQGMSEEYEEASRDLYATPWRTFRRVTLPMIAPGVFAGAMLAFPMSMDDFITSMLLSGGGATTLPVYIFSLICIGTSPELNAISTLVILASLSFAVVVVLLRRR